MKVGVLALQGDVPEQRRAFEAVLGPNSVDAVRTSTDLDGIDALAIPGGESTAISRLIDEAGVRGPLEHRIGAGLPVLATCAGLILLSRRLERVPGHRDPAPIGILDVLVRRNDYGRQRESFEAPVHVEGLDGPPFPGVFIRAPRILTVGPGVRVIARTQSEVVGVASGKVWGLTFHPELSADRRLHERFLSETLETRFRARGRGRRGERPPGRPNRRS